MQICRIVPGIRRLSCADAFVENGSWPATNRKFPIIESAEYAISDNEVGENQEKRPRTLPFTRTPHGGREGAQIPCIFDISIPIS